jgi:hypothetical protein
MQCTREHQAATIDQTALAPPPIKTLADRRKRLGRIPLNRIWFKSPPGTAIEKNVLEVEIRENRLCEPVDGTLDSGDVLPGFVLALGEFLDKSRRSRQPRG